MQVYDLKEIMLDIQELRKDLDNVVLRLKTRGFQFDTETFVVKESERKGIQNLTQLSQNMRNSLSKEIGIAKSKGDDVSALMAQVAGTGESFKKSEQRLIELQTELQSMLLNVPNLPHKSVPAGKSEADNIEVRKNGIPRTFDFAVKDHTDIGAPLGLDFDTGIKLSGARFTFMRGQIAKLHRALSQFMLDTQTEKHGYEECYTPYIVNDATLLGTGQLPKFEADLFQVSFGGTSDKSVETGTLVTIQLDSGLQSRTEVVKNWYLIPTSEVTLTNTVRNEIVPLEALPIKLTAHTPCFRSEAGSYGKDTKGMIRQIGRAHV